MLSSLSTFKRMQTIAIRQRIKFLNYSKKLCANLIDIMEMENFKRLNQMQGSMFIGKAFKIFWYVEK